jgi:mono/diheme cytochrome c family protein
MVTMARLITGLGLLALATTAGAGTLQTAGAAPGVIAKGEQVYAAQKCSMCHSLDGKGQAKGPLDGIGSKLKADEIREWIVNPAEMTKKHNATRKPVMRAYPKLPKEDLDALVAFLASKTKK